MESERARRRAPVVCVLYANVNQCPSPPNPPPRAAHTPGKRGGGGRRVRFLRQEHQPKPLAHVQPPLRARHVEQRAAAPADRRGARQVRDSHEPVVYDELRGRVDGLDACCNHDEVLLLLGWSGERGLASGENMVRIEWMEVRPGSSSPVRPEDDMGRKSKLRRTRSAPRGGRSTESWRFKELIISAEPDQTKTAAVCKIGEGRDVRPEATRPSMAERNEDVRQSRESTSARTGTRTAATTTTARKSIAPPPIHRPFRD